MATTSHHQPMDLANMRQNGVRHLVAYCLTCHHSAAVLVDHLPGDVPVPSLSRKMRCSRCKGRNVDARPAWHLKEDVPKREKTPPSR